MALPRHLLKQRMTVQDLIETVVDGAPTYSYTNIATNVRCFLDLSLIRKGKDPGWTPEAGRPADRSGVLFCNVGDVVLKPGQRIVITKGSPAGTFEIQGAIDTVPNARKGETAHLEAFVQEVAASVA